MNIVAQNHLVYPKSLKMDLNTGFLSQHQFSQTFLSFLYHILVEKNSFLPLGQVQDLNKMVCSFITNLAGKV